MGPSRRVPTARLPAGLALSAPTSSATGAILLGPTLGGSPSRRAPLSARSRACTRASPAARRGRPRARQVDRQVQRDLPGRRVSTTIRDAEEGGLVGAVRDEHRRPAGLGADLRTSSCSRSRVSASSAANGSSSRNSGVSAASARAIATRCCWPPLISQILRSAVPSSPTRCSSSSRRSARPFPGTLAYFSARSTLPPTVRHGNSRGCWNTTPGARPGVGRRAGHAHLALGRLARTRRSAAAACSSRSPTRRPAPGTRPARRRGRPGPAR